MISEEQAREMLRLCEVRLGSLITLRSQLLGNNPKAALWELVVLFACIDAAPNIKHEPGPGFPDVMLFDEDEQLLLSIEATFIGSDSSGCQRLFDDFCEFITKHVKKYQPLIRGLDINISSHIDKSKDVTLPDRHRWSNLLTSLVTTQYVELDKSGEQTIVIEAEDLEINLKRRGDDMNLYSGFSPDDTKVVSNHACYRRLKQKGAQINKWSTEIRDKPILIIIGSDSNSCDSVNDTGPITVRQAVYSALLETDKKSTVQKINMTGQFGVGHGRFNVHGSKHISGVLMIHLANNSSGWLTTNRNKTPKEDYYRNEDCIHLIPKDLSPVMNKIDFKKIVYGPGSEAWDHGKDISHIKRYKWEGGPLSVGNDGMLKLPASFVLQILSGEAALSDFYGDHDHGFSASKFLRRALADGRKIVNVELIEGNPLIREVDEILITLGPKQDRVIAVPKQNR